LQRTTFIKSIEEAGCMLVQHGAKHDWYR